MFVKGTILIVEQVFGSSQVSYVQMVACSISLLWYNENTYLEQLIVTILQAIILGIVQGISEFLPISSSGHLVLVPYLFDWQDQGIAFDAIVHLGTLFAVVVYFRVRVWALLSALFSRDPLKALDKRLAWLAMMSMIPALLFGFIIEKVLEISFRSPIIIAVNLIVWGIVLYLAELYAQKKQSTVGDLDVTKLTISNVLAIGLAQALALLPGTSRSGITMTAGLFAGISKKGAAELSFLMSIPIITIAGGLKLFELIQTGSSQVSASALGAGFLAASLSGFLAIKGLMNIIQAKGFWPFVVYRVVLGVGLLFLFL